jgi:hypothetical protein
MSSSPNYNDTLVKQANPTFKSQPNGGVIRLRNWQPEAFKLADERFVIFNAAGSAGKTTLQIALAIHDHTKGRKQIISAPQEVICQQFCIPMQIEVDGVTHSWAPRNLVGETAALRKWLTTDSKDIVVTTHAALTRVFFSLSVKKQITVLANTTLRIDESHHVLFSEDKTNKLGAIVKAAYNTPSAHIHMTTATDFRTAGDILPADVRKDFKKYNLSFDKLWQWLGIESFEHVWETYAVGATPVAAILARVAIEPNEYHLIFVPHANKSWRNGSPESLKPLFDSLLTIYSPDQILDLTQGDSQDDNKDSLVAGYLGKVVVSCEVGREGMTWPPCSRLHITSEDQAPNRVSQTLYRLFRPCDGKTKTVCCNYIPDFDVTTATKREHLTDANNVVLALLLDEEMFFPIPVEAPAPYVRKQSLQEIFGESYEDMKADLQMEVEALPDLRIGLEAILDAIMNVANIRTEDRRRVRNALRRLVIVMRAIRHPQELKAIRGMDAAAMRTKAGFDKVVESLRLNQICAHTTQHMDATTMAEYRAGIAVLNSMKPKTLAETVLLAEKLTRDNGGLLPRGTWLRANGHHSIRTALQNHPEALAHLKREEGGTQKTLAETVSLAEKLTEANGGLLPTMTWLKANGHHRVWNQLRKYPEAFVHLRREGKIHKTLAESVSIAEKLTEDNGGLLPRITWLKAGGYQHIIGALYQYPEAFAHIERKR